MSAPEVICIGETMALVTPASAEPLERARDFRIGAAGAESNVACHLAALGVATRWISQLGHDPLGRRILAELRGRGVDVDAVRITDEAPTGLYVKDPGGLVHYYRSGSAASRMGPDLLRDNDFRGVRVVHLSGITPALSASCAELVERAFVLARRVGATISFDVNYRPALWPDRDTAANTIAGFARRADLVFVGLDEAEVLWDAAGPAEVAGEFAEAGTVVVKDGAVGATAVSAGSLIFEPAPVVAVVEPVGAGDAFAAGYLAGMLAGRPVDERLRGGHRQAALVLGTTHDLAPLLDIAETAEAAELAELADRSTEE